MAELKQQAQSLDLENVIFKGFVQYSELPDLYSRVDCVVVPSYGEVWGLIVNEALASGAYVICSDTVGAADDLVDVGVNGDVFTTGDVNDLSRSMAGAQGMAANLSALRDERSKDAVQQFGIPQSADRFMQAITLSTKASGA